MNWYKVVSPFTETEIITEKRVLHCKTQLCYKIKYFSSIKLILHYFEHIFHLNNVTVIC